MASVEERQSMKQTGTAEETGAEVVNSVVDEAARLGVRRYFTIPGRDPFDEIEWEIRDAVIPGRGGPAFEQRGVEFPKFWSQTATNIVAQKYFRGRLSSPERESSVKQMIGRVVDTVVSWGTRGGYFADDEEADTFEAELKTILVNQYASFNSPVWFNVGFEEKPQCSACFILSIEDSMEAILDWIRREGVIFRGGSGSGVNRLGSGRRRSSSRRAGTPPAPSRSCAAPTRRPARSSRAARHAARRRWSCSTSTIRTSRSSSGARPRRSARRASSSRPATTCRSTAPTGRRSSTRTRTTPSASATRSWKPQREAT